MNKFTSSKAFAPALRFAGTIGTVGGFVADVLSPLGPILKALFYISGVAAIIFGLIYVLLKSNLKDLLQKMFVSAIFFCFIFGIFLQLNKGTENGLLGDNLEVVNRLQGSLNLIDKKLDNISNEIQSVGKDLKDVKEIITGDAELKNMTSSEDLNVTKELNERTKDVNAKRIAILYFSNSSEKSELNMLKKGLADMMISDLSNINMINIVERDRLESILKEQKLNNTQDFDPETASEIGRLLGAEIILTGAYFEMFGSLRVDARFIDVTTGEILKSDGVDGESSKFFKIQKQLSWKIIKNLDAKLSEEERNLLETKQNEELISFQGVQDFSKALDLYDNKKNEEAKIIVENIIKSYPNFPPALDLLAKLN